jgi:hypothetical protein
MKFDGKASQMSFNFNTLRRVIPYTLEVAVGGIVTVGYIWQFLHKLLEREIG